MKKGIKYRLIKFKKTYKDDELLKNLSDVAKNLKKNYLTQEEYNSSSIKITSSMTFKRRFGKWNTALERAGLVVSKEMDISTEKLLLNLFNVSQKLGTPNFSKDDLVKPNSSYSISAYKKVFDNWTNAKKAFAKYLSSKQDFSKSNVETKVNYSLRRNHETSKNISIQYQNEVKKKHKYICSVNACGCGEAIGNKGKKYYKKLFVIHIKPWEDGGETILKNLTVLCEQHYKDKFLKISNKLKDQKQHVRSRRIDPKVKEEVLRRDKHRCVFCKMGPYEKGTKYCKKIVIDHKKPFIKGGSNALSNLQVLCEKHNLEKMAKEY